ncbi:MAG: 4-hydroxybenzoate octaprenyltransferase [Verrucomicrobia bacterium]|nr:4-hydroxybenzoate octaprenyltransferase [Verrucomicrobiota bacterium]MBS0636525.1 4-hydroxybenzoate octaprenyltransferase [Verrucomicrobiota bacterium]
MNIVAIRRLLLLKQTLFGLTWIGSGALLPFLQRETPPFKLTSWLLLTLAFISARFSGMCFNSFFDRTFDAKNPRTRDRPLPKGEISPRSCVTQAVLYLAIFFLASWSINSLCGLLSLAVGSSVVLYSLTKRITPLCHFALGSIYFFAPFCAWAAIMGEISPIPFLFGLALFFTIAASDIIYACQDVEFDERMGLYSVPCVYGVTRALIIAALLHTASALSLFLQSYLLGSWFLFTAAACVAFVYTFCYLKLVLGQISYMAAFSRINMLSGMILFVFIVLELLF